MEKLNEEGKRLLNNIEFIESKVLTKGVTKISKKINKSKRIQKKWNKKYGYIYVPIPDLNIYLFDGKCIAHPITIKKIIKEANKKRGS